MINKVLLHKLYIQERKSGVEISKILNIPYSTIYRRLEKFGIPRRSPSEVNKGKHWSPKTEFKKGIHYSSETEFKKGHHPKTEFKKGHKESLEVKEKRIKNVLKKSHAKPNKKEMKLNSILQSLLPNEYSINVKGKIMILGGKIPDFVNINGQKKIIELFGDYWHSDEFIQRTGHSVSEKDRINYFKQFGWDTLVIWEHELKNENLLKERILNF